MCLWDKTMCLWDKTMCLWDKQCVYEIKQCVYEIKQCVYEIKQCVYEIKQCVYEIKQCVYEIKGMVIFEGAFYLGWRQQVSALALDHLQVLSGVLEETIQCKGNMWYSYFKNPQRDLVRLLQILQLCFDLPYLLSHCILNTTGMSQLKIKKKCVYVSWLT
jgi:hypothetical protein